MDLYSLWHSLHFAGRLSTKFGQVSDSGVNLCRDSILLVKSQKVLNIIIDNFTIKGAALHLDKRERPDQRSCGRGR